MALTPIQAVRLFIADSTDPYTFADEEIQYFLDMTGSNVRQASIYAIYAIIADLAKNKSVYRETAGHYEVWSNALDWYKLLLGNITSNPTLGLGNLSVYVAGIDRGDMLSSQYDCSSNPGNLVDTVQKSECGIGNCLNRFYNGVPDLPYWTVRL